MVKMITICSYSHFTQRPEFISMNEVAIEAKGGSRLYKWKRVV